MVFHDFYGKMQEFEITVRKKNRMVGTSGDCFLPAFLIFSKSSHNLQNGFMKVWQIFINCNRLLQNNTVVAGRTDQFDDCEKHDLRFFTYDMILFHRLQVIDIKRR